MPIGLGQCAWNGFIPYLSSDHVMSSPLSDDADGVQGVQSVMEGAEVWPPPHYDPLVPLQIPFGPRTRHMRTVLAAEARPCR